MLMPIGFAFEFLYKLVVNTTDKVAEVISCKF